MTTTQLKSFNNLVLYAVDSEMAYQRLVAVSIESLRYFNLSIPIDVYVFGKVSPLLLNAARQYHFRINRRPSRPKVLSTALKWWAISDVAPQARVLFVDADTFFFGDPASLFAQHLEKDFYASREFATTGPAWRGPQLVPMRIDRRGFARLRRRYNSKSIAVYNSSVMLLNHRMQTRIRQKMSVYEFTLAGFISGRLTYPCNLPFIAEEICASLILGTFRKQKFGFLKKGSMTHFNQWFHSGGEPGIVMHVGNGHTVQFCEHFHLKDLARNLTHIFKRTKRRNFNHPLM